MLCFFMNLFMLMWIIVLLLLNRNLVSVLYNLVLFMLVGFRNRNELLGWFGLDRFVCEWCMVLEMILIVFFWFIMCLCSIFFMCSSLLCLFFSMWLIGMLV